MSRSMQRHKRLGKWAAAGFPHVYAPNTKDLHLAKSCKLTKYDKFVIRCDATNLAYPVSVKDCILIRSNYRRRQSASQASGACFVMGQAADASTTIRTSGRLDVPEFLANPALVWESVHQAGESPRGSLVTTDACQVPLGAVIDLRMGFFKTRLDQCIRPTIQQGAVPRLGGPTSGRMCLRSDHRPSLSCHRLARISQCNGVDPCTTRLDLIAPRNSHRCFPGSWHELIAWIRNLWNKENMKIIDRRQT